VATPHMSATKTIAGNSTSSRSPICRAYSRSQLSTAIFTASHTVPVAAGQTSGREYEERHVPCQILPASAFRPVSPKCPLQGLWMKFRERNIYSTCWRECFRSSEAGRAAKKVDIHRVPHRLCTRYSLYCTGYPQHLRTAGFAAGATAVSVAGYLFSPAQKGRSCHGLDPGGPPPAHLCGKAVDSGDNSGRSPASGPRRLIVRACG
jgi:hypothetical protein